MSILEVWTLRTNLELCGVPIPFFFGYWCQAPADPSTVPPVESISCIVPRDLHKVPVILLVGAVEVRVNLVAANDSSDKAPLIFITGLSGLRCQSWGS